MKKINLVLLLSCLVILLAQTACNRQESCEACYPYQPPKPPNRPPIADAGPDQTIILPIDRALLNGSASNDPDGRISGLLWKRISGPGSPNIINANSVQAEATNLTEGVYEFELSVTDSLGLSDKDTTTVIVIKLFTNEATFNDQIWVYNYTSYIIIPDIYNHLPTGVSFKVYMKRDNTTTWQEVLQTSGSDFGFHIDNADLWIVSMTGSNETDTPDIMIAY